MAFTLKDQRLWIDGFDFTGIMNAIRVDGVSEGKERTTFGNDSIQRLPGPLDFTMVHEGFFEADPYDQAVFDRIGGPDPVLMSVGAQGSAEGQIGYSGEVMLSDYGPGAPHGEVFAFGLSAEGQAQTGLARSTILRNATDTATGDGTAFQIGTIADGKTFAAALHVLAVSGTAPLLNVIIESDDDPGFASPTTRATFTTLSAIGAGRQIINGPVTDDYWRCGFTIGGTSPSFTFVVLLGPAARK